MAFSTLSKDGESSSVGMIGSVVDTLPYVVISADPCIAIVQQHDVVVSQKHSEGGIHVIKAIFHIIR